MLLLVSVAATAAEIPIVQVTASSTWYTYNVQNLINGAGLSGDLHSGDFHFKWMVNGTKTGWLLFNLGDTPIDLTSTKIWNYGPGCCGNERSTKDLNVFASIDGLVFSPVATLLLAQPNADPFPGATFDLTGISARFIRFDLLSNYGDDEYTGLSEVKFFGETEDSTVPEPASLLLLGIGFGALALWRPRK
jgi:hypothetical protein